MLEASTHRNCMTNPRFFIAILKILLRDESLASDVDLAALSKRTELFSGSDLKRTRFLYCIGLLNGLELND